MKIGVVGVGMVGGALLKALSQKGFKTLSYDKYKPEFNEGLHILESDICFVCVPTVTDVDKQDLFPLHEVLTILSMENYSGLVVIKSTVLPGTTKEMSRIYGNLRLAHNPEFLKEASAFKDTMNQPVALCGVQRLDDAVLLSGFWKKFDSELDVQVYTPTVTEMAKYVHNCFLATKVSFCNEIFDVCERLSIPYEQVMDGAIAVGGIGSGHTRVPGPQVGSNGKHLKGYGGSCFPKDMAAFKGLAQRLEIKIDTILGAINSNKRRRPEEQS